MLYVDYRFICLSISFLLIFYNKTNYCYFIECTLLVDYEIDMTVWKWKQTINFASNLLTQPTFSVITVNI